MLLTHGEDSRVVAAPPVRYALADHQRWQAFRPVDQRLLRPERLARLRIDCVDEAEAVRHVQPAVDVDRRDHVAVRQIEIGIRGEDRRVGLLVPPRDAQPIDVRRVDLRERRVPRGTLARGVEAPVAGVLRVQRCCAGARDQQPEQRLQPHVTSAHARAPPRPMACLAARLLSSVALGPPRLRCKARTQRR